MTYTYAPAAVYDDSTDDFAFGAVGIFRATVGGDAVEVTDLDGNPIAGVLVGPKGAHGAFLTEDVPEGVLDFDGLLLPTASLEARRVGLEAKALAISAAADAAQALALLGNLPTGDTDHPAVVWGTNVDPTGLPDGTVIIDLPDVSTAPPPDDIPPPEVPAPPGTGVDGPALFAETAALLATLVPQSMAGCLAYYSATGMTGGAAVATWTDLSPNHRNLVQATSGSQPAVVSSGVSGLPGVRFAPGKRLATAAGAFTTGTAQMPQTTIMAVHFTAPPSASTSLLFSNQQYLNVAANGSLFYSDGTTTGNGEISVVGEPHVLRVTRTATNVETYLDGQLLTTAALGTNAKTWGWALNILPTTNATLDVTVAELGFFDGRTFDSADAEQVERYLLAKYKIPAPIAAHGTSQRFLDSVGVNVHTSFTGPPAGYTGPAPDTDITKLVPAVTGLGVKYVRDHSYPADAAIRARQQALIAAGVKIGLICPSTATGQSDTFTAHVAQALPGGTHAGGVAHFEPANEYDLTGGSWATPLRSEQTALWTAVRAQSALNAVPVLGPSFGTSTVGAATYGNDAAHMDAANAHVYAGGRVAELAVSNAMLVERDLNAPGKPVHVTEVGHHNAINTTSAEFGVSEQAQAVYTLRSVLEAFRRGAYRTFVYELFDDWNEPELTSNARHWGLMRYNGTPKPAYTALKNLLGIIADGGTPTAGSLTYNITSETGVREVLLSRSGGGFDLILWQPATVWNRPPTKTDRAVDDIAAAVSFTTSRTVNVYRPLLGSTVQVADTGTTVGVRVPADPVILRIT